MSSLGKDEETAASERVDEELSSLTSSLSIGQTSGDKQITSSPNPTKQTSNELLPDKKVMLNVGMFEISMEPNKPIYKYDIDIDEDNEAKSVGREAQDDLRNISDRMNRSEEGRRAVIERALENWITDTKSAGCSKKIDFNYVIDRSCSSIYALIDMFAQDQNQTTESLKLKVNLDLEIIVDGKLVYEPSYFVVKLQRATKLCLGDVSNYCSENISPEMNITLDEYLKAISEILYSKLSNKPENVIARNGVFPFRSENQIKINPCIISIRGWSINTRLAKCGLVFNVSNAILPFYAEISLINLLRERFCVYDLYKPVDKDIIEKLKTEILNKQVEARHINYGKPYRPNYKKYRVLDIAGSSLDERYNLVDKLTGETRGVTIQEHFWLKYRVDLEYPNLPCIVDNGCRLPIEVCHLVGRQNVTRKLDLAEVGKVNYYFSAYKPQEHIKLINDFAIEIQSISSQLKDFGINFNPRPIEITARELAPVSLVSGTRDDIRPNEFGVYNVQRDCLFKPVKIDKWILVYLMDEEMHQDKRLNCLDGVRFSELYCEEGKLKGISVPQLAYEDYINARVGVQELKDELKKSFNRWETEIIDHVIVLLPKQCQDWIFTYLQYLEASEQECKRLDERRTRISCLRYKNFKQKIINGRDKTFVTHLWLKHNTKLGGSNFALKNDQSFEFLEDGYLFISIEACQPSPKDSPTPSVAVIIGLWDLSNENLSRCNKLIIENNHSAINEILDAYFENKKSYPTKIVILRDLNHENELETVREKHLMDIKSLFRGKYSSAQLEKPLITCLVAQHNQKIKFIRQEPFQAQQGLDYNVQPGTVVDSTITHPNDFSFYLASLKSVYGISDMVYYQMLCNEIQLPHMQVESMIFSLSYMLTTLCEERYDNSRERTTRGRRRVLFTQRPYNRVY